MDSFRFTCRSFTLIAALALTAPSVHAEAAKTTCLDRAGAILAALDSGRFDDSRADFDQKMLENLASEQLRAVWESLPAQAGARVKVAPGRSTQSADSETAIIPMQYEKAWLDLQVSCDADGKVNGLFVRPGKDPAAVSAAPMLPPAYVDGSRIRERELMVESAGWSLPGTLTMPKAATAENPVPAVALVHGSGPHDRDETIAGNKPFRDLAQGLASRGIAVLRYEKRSFKAPQSFSGKAYTVREEVIDDALAALKLLSEQPGIDAKRVFVVGHSLGAMLAPRIAAEAPQVAGMVLLAAPARSLIEIIPFQLDYLARLDGKIDDAERARLDEVKALIARIRALRDKDRDDPALLFGAPASYWLDLANYDSIAAAEALARPTLLVQGEGDFQVTVQEDYQPWVARLGDKDWFTAKSISEVGHLFTAAGDPPAPADYETVGFVDVRVIEAVSGWIKS